MPWPWGQARVDGQTDGQTDRTSFNSYCLVSVEGDSRWVP